MKRSDGKWRGAVVLDPRNGMTDYIKRKLACLFATRTCSGARDCTYSGHSYVVKGDGTACTGWPSARPVHMPWYPSSARTRQKYHTAAARVQRHAAIVYGDASRRLFFMLWYTSAVQVDTDDDGDPLEKDLPRDEIADTLLRLKPSKQPMATPARKNAAADGAAGADTGGKKKVTGKGKGKAKASEYMCCVCVTYILSPDTDMRLRVSAECICARFRRKCSP